MKYRLFASGLLMLFIAAFLPAAADREESPGEEILITDGLGREVVLETPVERIVLAGRANLFLVNAVYLFPEAANRVKALAQTDQGLGDSFPYLDRDYPEKRRMSNSAGVEEIISLSPDLVILKDSSYQDTGPQLERLNVPVLTLGLESYEAYLADIKLLGAVFDNPDRAEKVIQLLTGTVETVRRISSTADDLPRILMLSYTSRDGSTVFQVPPADWIQTFMTETAGGIPVWSEYHQTGGWRSVNFEQIAQWDPDMIFLISYNWPVSQAVDVIESSPQWQELRAYKSGSVLPFPGDYHSWAQADIRWFLGLQWLAAQLHPQQYSRIDMQQKVIDFYGSLYGISEKTVTDAILPRLKEELPGRNK